jgi:putative oxidoreductase
MRQEDRIALSLVLMRLTVFLLMFMWTIDKFINPDHAAGVYAKFYFLGGLGSVAIYVIGVIELAILVGFILGIKKQFTYGAVLIFHGISTLSAFRQYFAPFEGPNLLFFAAWPALAACFALYSLRDLDTWWVLGQSHENDDLSKRHAAA